MKTYEADYTNPETGKTEKRRVTIPPRDDNDDLGDNAPPCPECGATGQHYKICSWSEE